MAFDSPHAICCPKVGRNMVWYGAQVKVERQPRDWRWKQSGHSMSGLSFAAGTRDADACRRMLPKMIVSEVEFRTDLDRGRPGGREISAPEIREPLHLGDRQFGLSLGVPSPYAE